MLTKQRNFFLFKNFKIYFDNRNIYIHKKWEKINISTFFIFSRTKDAGFDF